MKNKIFLIQLIFLLSCNKEINTNLSKIGINDKSFIVPITAINDIYFDLNSINYYKKITRLSWSCPLIYRYSIDSTDKIYLNTDIEITFPRYYYDSMIKSYKPVYYIIGIKDEPKLKGFVIIYLNRVLNKEEVLKYSPQEIVMTNQIDETTDTVFTTLNKGDFISIYPKFKGYFKEIKLDSLIIDYKNSNEGYPFEDYQFYNSIKLYDFELGHRWK